MFFFCISDTYIAVFFDCDQEASDICSCTRFRLKLYYRAVYNWNVYTLLPLPTKAQSGVLPFHPSNRMQCDLQIFSHALIESFCRSHTSVCPSQIEHPLVLSRLPNLDVSLSLYSFGAFPSSCLWLICSLFGCFTMTCAVWTGGFWSSPCQTWMNSHSNKRLVSKYIAKSSGRDDGDDGIVKWKNDMFDLFCHPWIPLSTSGYLIERRASNTSSPQFD